MGYRAGSDGNERSANAEQPSETRLDSQEAERASSGFQSYHRPIRRGTIQSSSSPDSQFTATTGLRGPHVNEADGTGIIAIGMALGSPTEERGSQGTSWQPQVVTTVTAADPDEQQIKDGLTRSKSRKWGIFGRSKSKRVKNGDRAIDSQEQVTSPGATPTRGTPTSAVTRGPRHTDLRDANLSPKTRKLGRSFTEPTSSDSKWSPQVSSPGSRIQTSPNATRPQRQEPISETGQSADQEPMLDVEIPNITLERYSVMFASLLERRSASSLLARRQVTQDKLRALRDDGTSANTQRETQQSRRKHSADRDLPPIPPLRLESLQITRGHQQPSRLRSNTSPAIMTTPSKETFPGSNQHEGETSKSPHIVRLASVKGDSPVKSSGMPSNSTEWPQLRSKFHIQSPTHKSSRSKSTINSSIDLSEREVLEGGLSPPPSQSRAQHTTAPAQPTSKPLQQTTRSTPYSTSTADAQGSLSLSLSSLSEEEPDEDQAKAVQDAVEISIARQISISRDQRRMLGPLQMHPIEGRRLAETKTSTPRLVDPRSDPSSPFAGHRNSERVVLERV